MNFDTFRRLIERIPYGKRLPTALYVYRDEKASFGEELDRLLSRLMVDHGADGRFNVVKFRLDELKLSLLSYPDFLDHPHPSLRQAITIDLARGKVRHTDYSDNPNPPILHRKESFLPSDHPKRGLFATLTQAEEAAGLYTNTATIGFRLNWERLLADKGLIIRGHKLCRVESNVEKKAAPTPVVERHKTALARYELSKPVRTLLEYGQLRPGVSFFDYGCGQGADVEGLRNLGYSAGGWDPVYRRSDGKSEADVVNLGYVLNVIEDPAERLETIVDAFHHARRLLVVSALINETVDVATARQYGDGVLTRSNTFQKYFEQQELQQYIEDALDTTAVPVSLGMFYVFRDPVEQQEFIEARTRRAIDWNQISGRLGLGQPRKSRSELLYDQHKELLDAFWETTLRLGRLPAPEEFSRHAELRDVMGSPKQALRLFVNRGGAELLGRAKEARCNDLLVYLALSNLRKRVPFVHLPASVRLDIRTFFGNHKRALAKGLELLYAAGDPDEIELACEDLKLGWQDEQALYLHWSLLDQLPPVLRAYVGCATALFGDVHQADVIKLHKSSGKVTFLAYDDFGNKPLPELRARIKVNLRTRWVQVFDHSADGQLLYFKERYLGPDYPGLNRLTEFSSKLTKLGISTNAVFGPAKSEFLALVARSGLNDNLNKKRIRGHSSSDRD